MGLDTYTQSVPIPAPMTDINTQIRNVIDGFVAELNGLVRQAALEAVAGALGTASASSALPRRGRPGPAKTAAPLARRPGAKRTPEELSQLTEELYGFIAANPGQGIEAIGKGMQIETKELALPVKKLIAERRISTEGQKRATKYYPASAAQVAKSKGGRSKRKG